EPAGSGLARRARTGNDIRVVWFGRLRVGVGLRVLWLGGRFEVRGGGFAEDCGWCHGGRGSGGESPGTHLLGPRRRRILGIVGPPPLPQAPSVSEGLRNFFLRLR